MTPSEEETNQSEIVIIRRRSGGEEEGHHGGAWKIAYADFVTAMMTFFLVMWLINSTSSKTITQIAAYFNPVRLTDKVPTTKGLEDAGVGQGPEKDAFATRERRPDARSEQAAAKKSNKPREEAIFNDPYAMLTELAAKADKELHLDAGQARNGDSNLANGQAYRDPFDPAFRLEIKQNQSEHPISVPEKDAEKDAGKGPDSAPETALDAARATGQDAAALAKELRPARATPVPKSEPRMAAQGTITTAEPAREIPSVREKARNAQQEEAARSAADASAQAEAAKLDAAIKQTLERALPGTIPHVDVTVTDEGVLISLTDDHDFGMFAIASAEPRPATVVIMAKIAKILAPRSESLIVRGHTDGRPYRNGTYDNWRLSTARAHMAYYMLVRGGIDEKKVERVEGYADRSLRIPSDPEAAQNRRIEILLRKAKP